MKQIRSFILFVLFIITIIVWSIALFPYDHALYIYFLDVGQGDATLIRTPQTHSILIDGGPGKTVLQRLGEKLPYWDRGIDIMVLTHPDADHISGLLDVMETHAVSEVVELPQDEVQTERYKRWKAYREHEQEHFHNVHTVNTVRSLDGSFSLLFYAPSTKKENTNNNAVVTLLQYHNFTALFAADAEQEEEKDLLEQPIFLDVDVLKVGHHGSKTSSTAAFLDRVTPLIGIISAGKENRYGHPHAEVLQRYEQEHIQLYRTDTQGTIEVITTGNGFSVRVERS